MEESRKIYKFEGEEGEDFQIWLARTEAALEAKDVLFVVIEDHMDGSVELTSAVKLSIAKAKATIIQGLGDKPLHLVLPAKENPHTMMKLLKERYAVSNLVTKVQLHTKLSRMQYKGQVMSEYVGDFESLFNQLTAMGSSIDEDMKVATFLASYGDKTKSAFGHLVTVLQSREAGCTWETVSSALLQEYEEQIWANGAKNQIKRNVVNDLALTASGQKGSSLSANARKKSGHFRNRRKCWECGKPGHFARDHRNDSPRKSMNPYSYNKKEGGDGGNAHYATILMAQDKCRNEVDLLIHSGASDHMVNTDELLSDVRPVQRKTIVVGNGESLTTTHEGRLELTVTLGGGGPPVTRTVVFERVLYVPELAANLLSCSALCRDGYDLSFNKNACVVWHNEFVELQRIRCGGVYVVKGSLTKQTKGRAMIANSETLELWHHRLGHGNNQSIQELSRLHAVMGLDLESSVKGQDECLPVERESRISRR